MDLEICHLQTSRSKLLCLEHSGVPTSGFYSNLSLLSGVFWSPMFEVVTGVAVSYSTASEAFLSVAVTQQSNQFAQSMHLAASIRKVPPMEVAKT
jgi:hypothetical protein